VNKWKKDSSYHICSLAKTTMFRQRTIFGSELSVRLPEMQTTHVFVRFAALNHMPQSYKFNNFLFQETDNTCLLIYAPKS